MKHIKIKVPLLSAVAFLAFTGIGCKEQASEKIATNETRAIFPKGN